jgi:hypothetical protein
VHGEYMHRHHERRMYRNESMQRWTGVHWHVGWRMSSCGECGRDMLRCITLCIWVSMRISELLCGVCGHRNDEFIGGRTHRPDGTIHLAEHDAR